MSLARTPVVVAIAAFSFAAGIAATHLVERTALARTPFASSVFVPADGLVFRSFDGRVIAKLSYDRRGGSFDVYDREERPATGLRPDLVGPAKSPSDNPLEMYIK